MVIMVNMVMMIVIAMMILTIFKVILMILCSHLAKGEFCFRVSATGWNAHKPVNHDDCDNWLAKEDDGEDKGRLREFRCRPEHILVFYYPYHHPEIPNPNQTDPSTVLQFYSMRWFELRLWLRLRWGRWWWWCRWRQKDGQRSIVKMVRFRHVSPLTWHTDPILPHTIQLPIQARKVFELHSVIKWL